MAKNRQTKSVLTISISEKDKGSLAAIALAFDCIWGDEPNISELIRKIATGELRVVNSSTQQQPQIPDGVGTELAKAMASLSSIASLLYPDQQETGQQGAREMAEHNAFYEQCIEPKSKTQKYTAVCPHPVKGQSFFEVLGESEVDAVEKLHTLLESTALPENMLTDLLENALVLPSGDSRLNRYKMMLIASN
jgi:hypothetical protein